MSVREVIIPDLACPPKFGSPQRSPSGPGTSLLDAPVGSMATDAIQSQGNYKLNN
jgi:hypothetical protein